jgi:hypothetical protein
MTSSPDVGLAALQAHQPGHSPTAAEEDDGRPAG